MPSSTTLVNHAGPALSTTAQDGFTLGSTGRPDGAGGGKRPLPHIEDILTVNVDMSPYTPIDKVLHQAEAYWKQAQSSMTFGRPDEALKDFIRANIVLITVIKQNRGWVSLQMDNQAQYERYERLLREVSKRHGDFEQLKANIKADNARTGVRPTVVRPALVGAQQAQPGRTEAGRGPEPVINAVEARHVGAPDRPVPPAQKQKPVVHPKPEALHGNALQAAGRAKASDDLVQRFAKLRPGTSSLPAQDPRIRTHPLIPPDSSASPTSAEPPQPASLPAASPPSMPKVPAAIYYPPRGTVSSEAAELPSSAPRTMFTRTNSAASIHSASKPFKPPAPSEEVFVPAQSFGGVKVRPSLPYTNTISADDLYKCMRIGASFFSILIIDIRGRERFDEGHILSQATICLDPEVLRRKDISAAEIADSNVIAPASEQLLLERRFEFDLVVFYDQDSERIPPYPQSSTEKAITGFYDALTRYDFPEMMHKAVQPRLLEGGIESWIAKLGENSLQRSSTANSRIVAPLTRSLMNRRPTFVTRPIQDADEVKKWEKSIASLGAIRTTDDFLRRMPATTVQESMMQTSLSTAQVRQEGSFTTWPAAPARPAPTYPRTSYSGLAETTVGGTTVEKPLRGSLGSARQYRTGIANSGVLCFAISSLQALFATPGFSRELWSGDWEENYKNPPRKKGESSANPQLLMKMLRQVFTWLNYGERPWIDVGFFINYVKSIHARSGTKRKEEHEVFGGPAQQDAEEFFSFITANIDDETNLRRDRDAPKIAKDYTCQDGSLTENALDYWREHCKNSDSIIDKYFRGLEVFIAHCGSCGHETRVFAINDILIVNLMDAKGDKVDLERLLTLHQEETYLDDARCEKCGHKGRKRQVKFARMPDRFVFCLSRFHGALGGRKIHTKVRFPIRNFDLTQYCAEPDASGKSADDPHFSGRMVYDCYAVAVHAGSRLSGGHYYSYVQDELSRDPTDWWRCNDKQCDRVKIGSTDRADQTERMFRDGEAEAYLLFYRKQGA